MRANSHCITLIATEGPKKPGWIMHDPFSDFGPEVYRGPFAEAIELMPYVNRSALNLVVVDLRHLQGSCRTLLLTLRRELQPAKVIALTLPDDRARWSEVCEAGVDGCLGEPLTTEELQFIAGVTRPRSSAAAGRGTSPSSTARRTASDLTARELELMNCLAHGASDKEIAGVLKLSVLTVKRHLHNIYGKLGVTNRVQAINRVSPFQRD